MDLHYALSYIACSPLGCAYIHRLSYHNTHNLVLREPLAAPVAMELVLSRDVAEVGVSALRALAVVAG